MDLGFQGKLAIVTGSTAGIGSPSLPDSQRRAPK
jgi:hypothetical protein